MPALCRQVAYALGTTVACLAGGKPPTVSTIYQERYIRVSLLVYGAIFNPYYFSTSLFCLIPLGMQNDLRVAVDALIKFVVGYGGIVKVMVM